MDQKILELAIETLQKRKADIEAEIEALRGQIKGATPAPALKTTSVSLGRHRVRTPAERRAQAERMKAYWAAKKGSKPATKAPSAKAGFVKSAKSAAARKAQSEKMKAIWAKRRAESKKGK
jgi:hypothetical protein